MAEEIRRLLISADRLVHQRRQEVKQLLRRRPRADVVVGSVHFERFCNLGERLVGPVALEAIEQDAHIRPAEIERKIVSALLARRQPQIGREHTQ